VAGAVAITAPATSGTRIAMATSLT